MTILLNITTNPLTHTHSHPSFLTCLSRSPSDILDMFYHFLNSLCPPCRDLHETGFALFCRRCILHAGAAPRHCCTHPSPHTRKRALFSHDATQWGNVIQKCAKIPTSVYTRVWALLDLQRVLVSLDFWSEPPQLHLPTPPDRMGLSGGRDSSSDSRL